MAAADEAFLYLGADFEANLSFINGAEIKRLNSVYRGQKKPTDVLSFKLDDESGGDIVICQEIADKEASEWGLEFSAMYQLLTIHGILHLAGLDHEKVKDRAKMEDAEALIMEKLGVTLER